jgi:hypothetical protein
MSCSACQNRTSCIPLVSVTTCSPWSWRSQLATYERGASEALVARGIPCFDVAAIMEVDPTGARSPSIRLPIQITGRLAVRKGRMHEWCFGMGTHCLYALVCIGLGFQCIKFRALVWGFINNQRKPSAKN